MIKNFCIGIFTIASVVACAQQSTLRKYTAIDGLPQSEVRAMVEDQNGYLWIATQGGGLARYDGREFKVYTTLDGLLSNIVNTLMIDHENNIWMAHPRGITKFDGRNFKKFIQPSSFNGYKRIRRIFERDDSVFFVTHPGLVGKIYKDSVLYWGKQLVPDKNIFFTYVKPKRAVVHYMSDSSFVYFYEGKTKTLSHKKIFGQAKNIFSIGKNVAIKADDNYFIMDLSAGKFIPYDIKINKHIIFYDTLNEAFWTRNENKLYKEKVKEGGVESELVYDGAEVSQVMPDGEGNTWIASMGDGLIRYFNQDFDRCASEKLKPIMAIAEDRDNAMWIGARQLWKMKQGKIKTYDLPANTSGVAAIELASDGTLYVASHGGLGIYNEKTDNFNWLNRSDGLSSGNVSAIEADNKGGLWAGTLGAGLNYFDGKSFSLIPDASNLKTKNITALKYFPATASLFIGTDAGLDEWRNSKIKKIWFPEFDNASILSLSSYQDSLLLIGTAGAGFAVYNPQSKKKKIITPKDGLPSGFVFFVAADEENKIWVGTVNGISRIALNTDWEIYESSHFGFDNGLTGIETNQNAFYFGDGIKYFGLIDGIYQFNDLSRVHFMSHPTHLTGIEIFFDNAAVQQYGEADAGFFKIPSKLSVPHNLNHFTFHFNRVDKRNAKSIRYKYFLKNFDKAWSQPTASQEVTYGRLPAGQYTFNVMATNMNGSWDAEPLTYSFTILTPFYQTAWFIGLVILLLLALILYSVMYRMRRRVAKIMEVEHIRQREQENLRKEIARDFHDEMGNQLTRIINYVSLLKLSSHENGNQKQNGQSNGLGELFNKVEASAKTLYTGTRDFIWAIDPVNDELSQLFIHLRDFGVKLFEEKSINFRANNNMREAGKLPYGFSREANLIFKEAMTNAFKHSQANNVMLMMSKAYDIVSIELSDDGVGFDCSAIATNGLKNIKGRE